MRVLVCGGRKYTDRDAVFSKMDEIKPDDLITGMCTGADIFAHQWAKENLPDDQIHPFPADWKKYGNPAGPIRNSQMIKEGKPDLVVAFPGNTGTADMMSKARRAGIEVLDLSQPNKKE